MNAALLLASLLLPAVASATSTGQFITRWDAASRAPRVPGKTAEQTLATPELKALIDEFADVANAYRRQILEARTAGRRPRACPPATVDVAVDTVLAEVRALPLAWRSRAFADSFAAVMDERYPCAAGSPAV